MTDHTIVAVYDSATSAEAAVRALEAANVPASAISRHSREGSMSGASMTPGPAQGEERGFWSSLFGAEPDHDTSVYDRSMAGGGTVVSVQVPDAHHDSVTAILESHNPVDLDERAASYGLPTSGATPMTGATSTGATGTGATRTGISTGIADTDGKIQLAEENLVVGKRAVSGGTTRIRRYVVETPVEQEVTLHSERVVLDRHPVTGGTTVTGDAFTDRTIEMTETDEQAVVGKTAHVVEEISLRKEAIDRVETVKDTVRREDIKVETVPGEPSTTAPKTTPRI